MPTRRQGVMADVKVPEAFIDKVTKLRGDPLFGWSQYLWSHCQSPYSSSRELKGGKGSEGEEKCLSLLLQHTQSLLQRAGVLRWFSIGPG